MSNLKRKLKDINYTTKGLSINTPA